MHGLSLPSVSIFVHKQSHHIMIGRVDPMCTYIFSAAVHVCVCMLRFAVTIPNGTRTETQFIG